jgi:hypothetical protein
MWSNSSDQDGFLGTDRTVVARFEEGVGDHLHVLEVVRYRFDGDVSVLYVEAVEVAGPHSRSTPRRICLTTLVHLLSNLRLDEEFQIEVREEGPHD